MKSFILALSTVLFFSGCAGIQKKKVGLLPGMTLFEATYVAGQPTSVTSGLEELFVQFGTDVWSVRNGYLSHQIVVTYGSKVDAIKAKNLSRQPYFIKLNASQSNDLYAGAYSEMLTRAFTEKGVKVVSNQKEAGIIVEFDFKLNEKESVGSQTEMVPVTSYSSSMTSNTWNGANIFSANYFSNSTTTSLVPVVKTSTVISYDRGLEIKGTDAKNGRQLFVLTVQSRGQSSDKRELFAAMATAALPLIGKDVGQQLEFPVGTNDPLISFLKTGSRDGIFSKPAVQWIGKTQNFCVPKVPFGATKNTPVTLAIQLGQADIVKGLIACGSDASGRTFDGLPPIAVAAVSGQKEIFEYLLLNGANPMASVTPNTIQGKNPDIDIVDFLADAKYKEYRELLLEARKKRTPAKQQTKN